VALLVLTRRDHHGRVEEKRSGPVGMNQADQFVAALPGAPGSLFGRQTQCFNWMIISSKSMREAFS